MAKRILAILLALALGIGMFSVVAFADACEVCEEEECICEEEDDLGFFAALLARLMEMFGGDGFLSGLFGEEGIFGNLGDLFGSFGDIFAGAGEFIGGIFASIQNFFSRGLFQWITRFIGILIELDLWIHVKV